MCVCVSKTNDDTSGSTPEPPHHHAGVKHNIGKICFSNANVFACIHNLSSNNDPSFCFVPMGHTEWRTYLRLWRLQGAKRFPYPGLDRCAILHHFELLVLVLRLTNQKATFVHYSNSIFDFELHSGFFSGSATTTYNCCCTRKMTCHSGPRSFPLLPLETLGQSFIWN